MDSREIKSNLNMVNAPENLETKIRQNWQQQMKEEKTESKRNLPVWFSVAASITLVTTLFINFSYPPKIVSAAYSDLIADAHDHAGLNIPASVLKQQHGITTKSLPIEVSVTKYCNLNSSKMVHVKLHDTNKREAHIFVNDKTIDIPIYQAKNGEFENFKWEVIEHASKKSLLVLFSDEISSEKIHGLVDNMFQA